MKTVNNYIKHVYDTYRADAIHLEINVREPNGRITSLNDLITDGRYSNDKKTERVFDLQILPEQIKLIHEASDNFEHNPWKNPPYVQLELTYAQADAIYNLNAYYVCDSNNYIETHPTLWFKLDGIKQYLKKYHANNGHTLAFYDDYDPAFQLINMIVQTKAKGDAFLNGEVKNSAGTAIEYEKINRHVPIRQNVDKSIWQELDCNFYDEEDECWCIDAWSDLNQDTEGQVIAKVFADRVVFLDCASINEANVQDLIKTIRHEKF